MYIPCCPFLCFHRGLRRFERELEGGSQKKMSKKTPHKPLHKQNRGMGTYSGPLEVNLHLRTKRGNKREDLRQPEAQRGHQGSAPDGNWRALMGASGCGVNCPLCITPGDFKPNEGV